MIDLSSVFTDHEEAAEAAQSLYRAGGILAVRDAGFVVGWRGWVVEGASYPCPDQNWRMRSLSYECFWPTTGPLKAVDLHNGMRQLGGNHSNAGIYIIKSDMSLCPATYFKPDENKLNLYCNVIGLTAGWGWTCFHRFGYRVGHAVPLVISIKPLDKVIVVGDCLQLSIANSSDRSEELSSAYKLPLASLRNLAEMSTDLGDPSL